jgi:hypothetical protein
LPIALLPIAQRQKLGVESQANFQAASDMNNQVLQLAIDTDDAQDKRTVPGENMGAKTFDDHLRPMNPYSAAQYQHPLELRQRRRSGTRHGNYLNDNGATPHSTNS